MGESEVGARVLVEGAHASTVVPASLVDWVRELSKSARAQPVRTHDEGGESRGMNVRVGGHGS